MTSWGLCIDLEACVCCEGCVAACTMENQTPFWRGRFRTVVEEKTLGVFPTVRRVFTPRMCMHCEDPPCKDVCPTGATHIEPGGIVAVDGDRCIGCGYCMIACPYDARFPYESCDIKEGHQRFGAELVHKAAHVDKCNLCSHRIQAKMEPACVATCPTEARTFGDLDDPNSKVSRLKISQRAAVMKPELGTSPKVFYHGR